MVLPLPIPKPSMFKPEMFTGPPSDVYTLVATLGMEIARCWDDTQKRAEVPLTVDALRFSKAVWIEVFRYFCHQGWKITPVEPGTSKIFPGPGFRYSL